MSLSDQLKDMANQAAKEAGAIISEPMKQKLKEANIKHSKNGDAIGHLIESLTIKLEFARQDSTVLETIEAEEIEALQYEINNQKSIEKGVPDDRPF